MNGSTMQPPWYGVACGCRSGSQSRRCASGTAVAPLSAFEWSPALAATLRTRGARDVAELPRRSDWCAGAIPSTAAGAAAPTSKSQGRGMLIDEDVRTAGERQARTTRNSNLTRSCDRAPRCEPVVSLVRSRRAPPVPLIVLPKSCSCRCGPCPPPLSLVWVVCLLSFFVERCRCQSGVSTPISFKRWGERSS